LLIDLEKEKKNNWTLGLCVGMEKVKTVKTLIPCVSVLETMSKGNVLSWLFS